MGSKVGIVYATGSGILRRIIVPDDDKELNDPAHVGPGETIKVVAAAAANTIAKVIAQVHADKGRALPSGRCAVVANGKVEAIIQADPAIDSIPGKTLVASDTANIGDAA